MVIDFSQRSQLRQFELVVEGRSLYVNPHYLAEISPYFYTLCFSEEFRETRESRGELPDVSFEDMHELLRCVCPDENHMIEQRVSADNFALLTHLSNRLLLQNLRTQLERCADDDAMFEHASSAKLLEIIVEALAAQFSDALVTAMCKRLARHDEDAIKELTAKLPLQYASIIEQKLQPFIQYYHPPAVCVPPSSAYHWNDYSVRLFF